MSRPAHLAGVAALVVVALVCAGCTSDNSEVTTPEPTVTSTDSTPAENAPSSAEEAERTQDDETVPDESPGSGGSRSGDGVSDPSAGDTSDGSAEQSATGANSDGSTTSEPDLLTSDDDSDATAVDASGDDGNAATTTTTATATGVDDDGDATAVDASGDDESRQDSSMATACPAELEEGEGPALDLQCRLVAVPIDHGDPDVGTTDISVVVRPGSGDESLPPLVVLQGGPGGASSEMAAFMPDTPNTQVFIDQRGTGFGSTDFSCFEFSDILAELLEATTETAVSLQDEALNSCAERLSEDPVLAHTTTDNHAADVIDVMAALRNELGHSEWLVYGVSYGTTIALEIMRDAPAGLQGTVLDGVFPATLDMGVETARSAQRALDEMDQACAADPDCVEILAEAPSGEGTTISGLLSELIAGTNEVPIVVTLEADQTSIGQELDVWIDGDSLASLVFEMFYDDFLASLVPALIAGIADDDTYSDYLLALLVVELSVEAIAGTALGTNFAVNCAERLPLASEPPEALTDFAAAVTGGDVAEGCETWSVHTQPLQEVEPVISDLPVLMLSGRFDPVTPPTFAEVALEHLSQATHIVGDIRGHGMWGRDRGCIDKVVADFLADPDVALDTSCTAEVPPLNWERP